MELTRFNTIAENIIWFVAMRPVMTLVGLLPDPVQRDGLKIMGDKISNKKKKAKAAAKPAPKAASGLAEMKLATPRK